MGQTSSMKRQAKKRNMNVGIIYQREFEFVGPILFPMSLGVVPI